MTQLSDGLGNGLTQQRTIQEFAGDGSELHFTLSNRGTITKVENWVAGSTNDYAEKTHWTQDVDVNENTVLTFESGNAPIAAQKQKYTVTFPALASATSADHVIIKDATGTSWAISLDKTGSAAAPTGALYAAIAAGKKCHVNISTTTTAAQCATACVNAFNALTGLTAKITVTAVGDGTATFEIATTGDYTGSCLPKNSAESAAGSITVAETTVGKTYTLKVTFDTTNKETQRQLSDGMTNG